MYLRSLNHTEDGSGNVPEMIDLERLPLSALAPRERILRTASDLFYRFSIHAVGVDRIIAESGVAKMTFYKHFPSKANLVATYLRHKDAGWLQTVQCRLFGHVDRFPCILSD